MQFVDVAVVVKDAKASAQWWKEKVGFDVWRDGDHFVMVAPKGANVGLHLCEMKPLESGNTGIGFSVPDCKEEEGRLRANGVTITVETTTAPWGTYLMFADPDGNEFYVGEAPGFGGFAPQQATARRSTARKGAAKKPAAKKGGAKKPVRKAAPGKAAARKTPAKKSSAKKAAAKKGAKGKR